jgi:hypothetical protein
LGGLECLRVNFPTGVYPLPRPLVIPTVMTLKTLADVRALIFDHLPELAAPRIPDGTSPSWRSIHSAGSAARYCATATALNLVTTFFAFHRIPYRCTERESAPVLPRRDLAHRIFRIWPQCGCCQA